MRNILFITIFTLIFSGCSGRSGKTTGSNTNPLSTDNDGVQCSEHQELIADKCECVSGYVLDDQAKCVLVTQEKPQLAVPLVINLGTNVYKFDDVRDLEGNIVSAGSIRYIYKRLGDIISQLECSVFTDPLDCTKGTVYPKGTSVTLVSGKWCLKAIACADEYKESDVLEKLISASTGSGGAVTEEPK